MERSPSDIPVSSEASVASDGIDTDIGRLPVDRFAEYQYTKNRVWQILISDENLKKNHINICRASRKITKMIMKGMSLEYAIDIYRSRIKSVN